MVWLDGGDYKLALTCFEEACTVDGANASVHFCRAVALVKVRMGAGAGREIDPLQSRFRFGDDFSSTISNLTVGDSGGARKQAVGCGTSNLGGLRRKTTTAHASGRPSSEQTLPARPPAWRSA